MSCTQSWGCEPCTYDDPPPVGMEDVKLQLVQRERTWHLATADSQTSEDDRLGWVSWTFELPSGAIPGPAQLQAEGAQPVRFRIGGAY